MDVEYSHGFSMHLRTDKSPERDGAASKRAASKSRSRSRRKSRSRRRSRSKRSKSRGRRPGSWKRWLRHFLSEHGDTSLINLPRLFCLPKLVFVCAWSSHSVPLCHSVSFVVTAGVKVAGGEGAPVNLVTKRDPGRHWLDWL